MSGKSLLPCQSLAGSLLISAPGKETHPLEECVIFIFENSPKLGTQGVVVNRKSTLTIKDLLEKMGYEPLSHSLGGPLHHGGLDDENGILMLHTGEWYSSNTIPVTSEFSVSSDSFMIEKIASCDEPYNWLMCAGKCTWEPGELDQELKEKLWLTAPATFETVFTATTNERQWRKALDYCTKYTVDSWF